MKYVKETKVIVLMFGLVGASLMGLANYKESELRKQQDVQQVAESCEKESEKSHCTKVL